MSLKTQKASKFHTNKLWHTKDELGGAWKFLTFDTLLQILYGKIKHACDEFQNS